MNEDLRNWFREKWVRMDTKGNIKGDCAREEGEGKPKCLPLAKASGMSKEKRAAAARRKRREDPVADRPGKGGKPVNVATEEVSTSELIKKSHEKRGAPGTLKAKIDGPITLAKVRALKNRPNATTLDKKQANFYINMHTEEYLEEKNAPTNPSLWSKAKSLAKQKFDVYPSAYANGWAAKWYKSKGGGWKSLGEGTQMKPSKTAQEKFKSGLKKAGYDPDAGAKRLLDLIAKQKKEREEFESKYKSAYEGREMKSLKQIQEAASDNKHFSQQSTKMQDAINLHLRKGKSYKEAVAAAQKHVKEDIDEGTVVMSDFKVGKTGRKYKAHRATMEEVDQINEISLKPEHKAAIKRLRPSGSHSKTSIELDSGKQYSVTREGDKVHFVTHETGAGTSKKTTMKYSQFDESSDHMSEAKESGAMKDGKLQGHMVNFKPKGNLDGDEVVNKVKDIYKSLQSSHPDKVHKGAYSYGYGEYSFNDDHRGPKSGFVVVKSKEHLDAVKKHIKAHGATIQEDVSPYDELDEAGPFSYGAKPPRKGSVAYNAIMKRKEQKKGEQPVEPKDQMVGIAKVVKEDTKLDEARGRPAGAATLAKRAAAAAKPREDDDEGEHYDADSGVEADQHIHVQLKKAADSDQKPFEVSFRNGKKHTVSQKVAKDILSATERLKPEHRKNVHDEIHQSYDNLMSVHRLVAGR